MKRLTLLPLLALLLAGCGADPRVPELQTQLVQRERAIADLEGRVQELTQTVQAQQGQIERLRGLEGVRMEYLPQVERIDLGRHTGGYDTNGLPGDDGVRVYLRPIDGRGNVIPAVGEARVQVLDLDAPAAAQQVLQCTFGPDEIGEHWATGLLGSHYVLTCLWDEDRLPANPDLTLRVRFVDYLTGQEFTTQRAITINVPVPPQPAPDSQP